jgi:hypothetical protein
MRIPSSRQRRRRDSGSLPVTLAIALVLLTSRPGHAEEPCRPRPDNTPPAHDNEASDWVEYDSQECLVGELIQLRDERFSFDSDQLGDVNEDFEDLVRFASPHMYSYVDRRFNVYNGPAYVDENTLGHPKASCDFRAVTSSAFCRITSVS